MDRDHYVRLYSSPVFGARIRDICEAIYQRRGPFADRPFSPFEAFILTTCASEELDGEAVRRHHFEWMTGLCHVYDGNPSSATAGTYGNLLAAYNRTQPPYAGSKGNLRPKDVRRFTEMLAREGILPPSTLTHITADGYRVELEKQDGPRLFVLSLYGRFSRGGYSALSSVVLRSLDDPPQVAAPPPILNAFLDWERSCATIEEWEAAFTRNARKLRSIWDYLEATAP